MRVPASRADIFKDRSLSPLDKRALMRFLQKAQQSFLARGSSLVRGSSHACIPISSSYGHLLFGLLKTAHKRYVALALGQTLPLELQGSVSLVITAAGQACWQI